MLLVLVIVMSGVQLQINHKSLPKERKILSKCEARGQNLVLLVMTSDLSVIVRPTCRLLVNREPNSLKTKALMSIVLVLRLVIFI